eukprot:653821_1
MGNFAAKETCRISLLGLDNAGKTTLVQQLKTGKIMMEKPTVYCQTEAIDFKNISLVFYDVPGHTTRRAQWSDYYDMTDCVLWMVDSADANRMSESRDELRRVALDEKLKDVPFVVLANKVDHANALDIKEISAQLKLNELEHKYHLQAASVVKRIGVNEALDWIATNYKK